MAFYTSKWFIGSVIGAVIISVLAGAAFEEPILGVVVFLACVIGYLRGFIDYGRFLIYHAEL